MILEDKKPLLLLNAVSVVCFLTLFASLYHSLYTFAAMNTISGFLILLVNQSSKLNGRMKIAAMLFILVFTGSCIKYYANDEILKLDEIQQKV